MDEREELEILQSTTRRSCAHGKRGGGDLYGTQDVSDNKHGRGRWNWMSLEALSMEEKMAILQIYRPTKNLEDADSAYMQQKSHTSTDECLIA